MKKSTITAIAGKGAFFEVKVPTGLPRETHAHFKAICSHLYAINKYHETDQMMIAEYCLAKYEADKARSLYTTEGMQITSPQGARAHPMIAVANQCRTTMTKLASTLGLGAAHRHRLAAQTETNDASEKSSWHKAAA